MLLKDTDKTTLKSCLQRCKKSDQKNFQDAMVENKVIKKVKFEEIQKQAMG